MQTAILSTLYRSLFLTLLVSIGIWVAPFTSSAGHFTATDVVYTCVSDSQFNVTLNVYKDCSGPSMPNYLYVRVSSCIDTLCVNLEISTGGPIDVSPVCPAMISNTTCNGGTLPGYELYQYEGVFTVYHSCPNFIIGGI